MKGDDAAYFRKRLREEREAAIECEDNAIALAHLKMAEQYEKLIDGESAATYLREESSPSASPAETS